MKNPFKTVTKAEPDALAIVKKFGAQLSEKKTATRNAKLRIATALVAKNEGEPGADAEVSAARTALELAERDEREVGQVLVEYEKIHAESIRAEKRRILKGYFETADKQLEKAMPMAIQIQQDTEKLLADLKTLNEICLEALRSVPRTDPENPEVRLLDCVPGDSPLGQVMTAWRLQLRKNGHFWAISYYDDERKIRDMPSAIQDGRNWIMKSRPVD